FASVHFPVYTRPRDGPLRKTMSSDRSLPATFDAVSPVHEWIERAFRAHYAELCAFVSGVVGSEDGAEDVVQDVFLSVWRAPDRWLAAGDALRPMLFVAVRNRALDMLRRRRVRERYVEQVALIGVPTPVGPEEVLAHRELERAFDAAVAGLSARLREIYLLHRMEGLTYREIAEQLGISVQTVEVQMGRALKRLRAQLGGVVEEGDQPPPRAGPGP